jgi:hypothetical protein
MWTKAEIVGNWQEQLNIHYGMTKEEAFENFRTWREKKKTCQRCEGEKYTEYCPVNLICKEADTDERSITGDVDRSRDVEAVEHKAVRTQFHEERKRTSVR